MKVQSCSGFRVLVLSLVLAILVWPAMTVRGEPSGPVAELNAKLSKLDIDTATLADVIQLLGPPLKYVWRQKTLDQDNLPPVYNVLYPHGLTIAIEDGLPSSVQFSVPGLFYRGKLQVGSSLEDVLTVVGEPTKILVGGKHH